MFAGLMGLLSKIGIGAGAAGGAATTAVPAATGAVANAVPAVAGAAKGAGGIGGLFSSILGGGGGSGAPVQSATPWAAGQQPGSTQIPFRTVPNQVPRGSPSGPAKDGFSWDKFGDYLEGDKQGSPLTGLADFGDAMSRRNMQPIQSIPHPTPPGSPTQNRGVFGLENLVANMNRGGWGR